MLPPPLLLLLLLLLPLTSPLQPPSLILYPSRILTAVTPASLLYAKLLRNLNFDLITTVTDVTDPAWTRQVIRAYSSSSSSSSSSSFPPPRRLRAAPRLLVSHSMGVSTLLRDSRSIDYNIIISPNTYPFNLAIPPSLYPASTTLLTPPTPTPSPNLIAADPLKTLLVQYNRDTLDCSVHVATTLLPGCYVHRTAGDHFSGVGGKGLGEIVGGFVERMQKEFEGGGEGRGGGDWMTSDERVTAGFGALPHV